MQGVKQILIIVEKWWHREIEIMVATYRWFTVPYRWSKHQQYEDKMHAIVEELPRSRRVCLDRTAFALKLYWQKSNDIVKGVSCLLRVATEFQQYDRQMLYLAATRKFDTIVSVHLKKAAGATVPWTYFQFYRWEKWLCHDFRQLEQLSLL